MAKSTILYRKTVQVSEEYLGPAGERFIRRQIATHLNIQPEALAKRDMRKLINWSTIAFALLTNDQQVIESFAEDLQSLALKDT